MCGHCKSSLNIPRSDHFQYILEFTILVIMLLTTKQTDECRWRWKSITWVELWLPKRDVEVTNPHPHEGGLIWKDGLCRWNQDNNGSHWIKWGVALNPMIGILIRKAKFGRETLGKTGSDTAPSQAILKATSSTRSWEEARSVAPRVSEGEAPLPRTLISSFWPPESLSVV